MSATQQLIDFKMGADGTHCVQRLVRGSMRLRVLIVCESSGTVREAFRRLGHDAWSCDLLPADDGSENHYQCDAREVLTDEWDLVGMHPPCTYLSVSGIHWNNRGRGWDRTEKALGFVEWLMSHDMPWYLENPTSIISTRIRKPDQTIQPYDFGEDASKRTCLWLNRLPKLQPTKHVPGQWVTDPRNGKRVERWSNQTDSGQNKLPPSKNRWKERSKTYAGIALAMADQWAGEAPANASLERRSPAANTTTTHDNG